MNKKYKLTLVTKEWMGKTLFQIEAVVSFGSIVKGEKGGYIEKEENLSQVYGDAWVSGNAQVYGDARVFGDAQVYGKFSLIAGYFFGYCAKSEEIKTFDHDADNKIIYRNNWKGEAKIEPTEKVEEVSMTGKEVTVTIDGKTYTAVIK